MQPGILAEGGLTVQPYWVLVAIVQFQGDKLVHEHIYWDQASVLVQIGVLDPDRLPVTGAEQAHKVLDKTLPGNQMLPD